MERQISARAAQQGAPTKRAFDVEARGRDAHLETIRQLETALKSRIVIEQAKGILAERFELTVDEAFFLIRYAARSGRTSMRMLAVDLIGHPDATPELIAAALGRPERWRHERMGASVA